jgi:hypothetical protein
MILQIGTGKIFSLFLKYRHDGGENLEFVSFCFMTGIMLSRKRNVGGIN